MTSEDAAPPDAVPKVSLAILCYRAEEDIIAFVERMHAIFSDYRYSWELVLVANYAGGAADRTPAIARSLAARLTNTRCIAEEKQGMMGWDMRKGLEACRGDVLGVIDGDGQFPVEIVPACLAKVLHEEIDIVTTYRVMRFDGVWRGLMSGVYNTLFRMLFPGAHARDVNSKPKLLRRAAYERLNLRSDDWFLDAEIMIKAHRLHLRIAELPVHFLELQRRASFVRVATVWEFLRNLWSYRFGKLSE